MNEDRTDLSPRMAEEMERIDQWALLAAYAWMRLKSYDEIPEGVRGEVLISWSTAWLEAE